MPTLVRAGLRACSSGRCPAAAGLSGEKIVNIDRAVFVLAGTMILASVGLGFYVSSYWLLLTLFVGANMLQAAFTGFCPAAIILRKFGLRPGSAFGGAA
jgi:hypothetical protein